MQTLLRRLAEEHQTMRAQHAWRERVAVPGGSRLRWRVAGREMVSFCSNDYLGLAEHPAVIDACKAAVTRYGVGSGGSVFVGGYHQAHEQLEAHLARFLGRPRALLFGSGYLANLGVARSLFRKRDAVFEDRLSHASLIDASRATPARVARFRHRDTDHLTGLLHASASDCRFIVSDAIFSMDGDQASLPELVQLAQQHDALLWLDDAHGFGVVGAAGRGSLSAAGLDAHTDTLLVGTLGKAAACSGAFVAGSEVLIDAIAQRARSIIYTTAPPPAIAVAADAALDLIAAGDALRSRAFAIAASIKAALREIDIDVQGDALILPVVLGSNDRALAASRQLAEAGFLVKAIRPPTVPAGTARLRITVSAGHTDAEVEAFIAALLGVLRA